MKFKLWHDFTIRGAICLLVLVSAVFIQSFIESSTKSSLAQQLRSSSLTFADYASNWLNEHVLLVTRLATDPRLPQGLLEDEDVRSLGVRRSLYEFSYLNKIPNVYIYNGLNEAMSQTASALPLPPEVFDQLKQAAGKETLYFTQLLDVKGIPHVLVASAVTNQDNLSSFYYVLYMQQLSQALANLTLPDFPEIPEHDLALFYSPKAPNGWSLPNVRRATRLHDIATDSSLRFFFPGNSHTGLIDQPSTRLLATQKLDRHPQWYAGTSIVEPVVAKQSIWMIRGLWGGVVIICLMVLFYPSRGPYSVLLRQYLKETVNPQPAKSALVHAGQQAAFKSYSGPSPYGRKDSAAVPLPTPEVLMGRNAKTAERQLWEEIEESMSLHRTKLLYQPAFNAKTLKAEVFEVFLRIMNADGEVLPPGTFLPIASRYGMLPRIDAYVLSRVLDLHFVAAPTDIPLAVNLSGSTFESIAFVDTLVRRLEPHQAKNLIFELRSQEIIRDPQAMEFIRQCRQAGCLFSIDYFGGGEAMLQASKRMKFDYVKVDCQQFSGSDDKKKELIRLAKMAHNLELPLVLEKIETKGMMNFAQKIGIRDLQGYYLAKPSDRIENLEFIPPEEV
jgi:EAL domain-containing protein (putative c-di-GMP-specific phosphodiesterase class I)